MSDGSYGGAAERLMGMSDGTWERHANPWSVWTRIPILPLLALAAFSRAWIGWWCLVPLAALVVWAWANPRAFPPPARLDSWSARGVMGERVWLARKQRPIPFQHARAANVLTAIAAGGLIPLAYGLVALDGWATIAGTAVAMLGKLWFVDRMVWLYDETARERPEALGALGITPPPRPSPPQASHAPPLAARPG